MTNKSNYPSLTIEVDSKKFTLLAATPGNKLFFADNVGNTKIVRRAKVIGHSVFDSATGDYDNFKYFINETGYDILVDGD